MNIPLENQNDIYSLGFSKGLQREIPDNSTGVVYDTIEGATNTGSVLSGGNLNLKTLSIGGLVRQVAPGDDLQAAIDAVSREGGGTVQLLAQTYFITVPIYVKDKVSINGAGKGKTLLDFSTGSVSLHALSVSNWSVSELTMQKGGVTNTTPFFNIDQCTDFEIKNVSVDNGKFYGISITTSTDFLLEGVDVNTSTSSNFFFEGTTGECKRFVLRACVGTGSTSGRGFLFSASGSAISDFTLDSCKALNNIGTGFLMAQAVTVNANAILSSCLADGNGADGFDIDTTSTTLISCEARNNGSAGFLNRDVDNRFVGCRSLSNTSFDFQRTSPCTIVACSFGYTGSIAPSARMNLTELTSSNDYANLGQSFAHIRESVRMKNSAANTLRQGNVVVFSPTAAGDEVNTTTTNGNNKVIGMYEETTLTGEYGFLLTKGYTQNLYANNSASSITIGDHLSTYSHAYYAKKAVAGETSFAIALEAPTTSTAVIDALLISPRLI